ncbi:hypothetical protein B9Z55_026496 [Caenorhabditis nigoni]|uniref:Uncharacterized protein n=1 Tax=Caenorhabditis nigoni TaxID=1611254 RepID=A0A2G5T3J4_9PELO|nr:hypothetical protein B9Z55_026496 [Caenorhabditis nigoni]
MLSPLDEISKLTAKPIDAEFATAISNIPTPTKEYKPISSLESMVDKIGRKVYERQSLKKMGCAIRWFGKKDKKEASHHPKAQQPSHLSASSENSVLLNSFLVQQMLNRTVLLARNNYVKFFLKKPSLEETTVATTAPPTPPELKLMISGTTASETLDQSETAIQQMEAIVELEHELLKPQKELNIKQEFRRDFSISRILDGINIPASIVSSESDDHENQVKDTGPIKSETLIHKIARNATKTKMTMDVQAHVESYPATPIVPVKTAKMKTEPILDNESSDIGKMVDIKSDYSSFAETNWRPLRKTAARQQRDDLFFSSVAAKRPKLSKDVKKEKKDGITKHCVPVSPKVQCERTNCGKWFHMCCIFGHNEKYIEQKRKFYCCSRWAHENAKKAKDGVFSKQLCNK